MLEGKERALAVILTVAAGGWLVAGCSASASVSVGGPSPVPRQKVEKEVATTLARQESQPVPKVACPRDLKAQVGTVMYCSLTAQGSATAYPVKVQVDSVSETRVHFSIVVSTTPGVFTAPS